jgi:hypothetical protein
MREYGHVAWMMQGRVRNVYLGSNKKVRYKEILARARSGIEKPGIKSDL